MFLNDCFVWEAYVLFYLCARKAKWGQYSLFSISACSQFVIAFQTVVHTVNTNLRSTLHNYFPTYRGTDSITDRQTHKSNNPRRSMISYCQSRLQKTSLSPVGANIIQLFFQTSIFVLQEWIVCARVRPKTLLPVSGELSIKSGCRFLRQTRDITVYTTDILIRVLQTREGVQMFLWKRWRM